MSRVTGAEIAEELAQHAEDRDLEFQSNGHSEAAARRIALDELTDHELLAGGLRAVQHTNIPDPLVLDTAWSAPAAGWSRSHTR
jgi:hypothetical protein